MARIGSIIDGKYEILKEVGRGGMSVVYLAMDQRLNKQWAIKEVRLVDSDPLHKKVFHSLAIEAELIKKLDHPALPRIVDVFKSETTILVVMDYIEGATLEKVLEDQGAQSEDAVIDWALQLCDCMNYLHNQTPPIIYRDLKPPNIMVKPDGTVKLIDFGIAREFKEGKSSDTVALGTVGYAAPEQRNRNIQSDARTDIYGLGATLFHLVTGKTPCEPPHYEVKPIREINPMLSAGLERIISKSCRSNPDARYQSMPELMYALEHYEEEDDAYRAKEKRKLNVFTATAVGALVFALAAGLTYMGALGQRTADYRRLVSTGDYLAAMKLRPDQPDAYLRQIEEYKADGKLSSEEEEQLTMAEGSGYIDQLRPDVESFADVSYQLGTAYWFYSKSDASTHVEATKWFKEMAALSKNDFTGDRAEKLIRARRLVSIGKYYADSQLWAKEGVASKSGYRDYWKELTKLYAEDNGENQYVSLGIMNEIVKAVLNNRVKIESQGVKRADIISELQSVSDKLEGMEGQTEEGQKIISSTLDVTKAQLVNLGAQ